MVKKKFWDRNDVKLFAYIGTILILSFAAVMYIKYYNFEKSLQEREQGCRDLSAELLKLDKVCDCYYSNCETESAEINIRTLAYCACDCETENGTISVCLRLNK